MADAKHPLVAAHRAHAAPHLVGQCLEAQPVIGRSQRAGDAVARLASGDLRLQEDINRFFKAPLQEVGVSFEGDQRTIARVQVQRQVETVDGIEEEEGAHPLVQVIAGAPEAVQRGAFGQQLLFACAAADRVQRKVALRRVGRGDDADKLAHRTPHRSPILPAASSSTTRASTSSRSWPCKARANCALNKPYLTPRS